MGERETYQDGKGNKSALARRTHFITRRSASNLHHATRYADMIGLPLTQSVSINFSKTECDGDNASARFKTLRANHFAPWLRRHTRNKIGVAPTYVWVMEAGGRQVGAHWAVHVPKGMIRDFWRRLPGWLAAVAGALEAPTAIKHRRVRNITGLKRYMLKGMDPVWAPFYRVRPIDQGVIEGRRSGFSRNLGPSRRRASGYRSRRLFTPAR